MTTKQNWFPTLNDALAAEGLIELWPLGLNIGYGETRDTIQDGLYITVYRDERGFYERPLSYSVGECLGQVC